MSRSNSAWDRVLKRYILFSLTWFGVLVLSWVAWERGLELGGTAPWAGILHPLIFALTAWPVLRRFVRGERWLTIPNWVLGLTYLAIGLGSIYFVLRYNALGYEALRRPEEVRSGLLVAIVGIVAYRIGAEVPWSRKLTSTLPELPMTPPWSWGIRAGVLAAISVGSAATLFLAASGSFGFVTGQSGAGVSGVTSILGFVSEAGILALAGAYFYWFSRAQLSRGDKIFVVLATAWLAALALLSGMKEEFLIVLFSVAIPYLWSRRSARRPSGGRAKEAVLGLSLVGLMILLFAANPVYRTALGQLSGMENRIAQGRAAAGIVAEQLSRGDEVGSLAWTGVENAWGRLSIFPYHVAVIDQLPEHHQFRGFDRYPLLPAMSLVPRVLWPEKPVNTAGSDFQREFISSEVVYSTTPTVYGWSFIELGVAGVVLIMAALGGIARLVEQYLAQSQRGKLCALILYTALFVRLAEIEADPFWTLGGIPKIVVIALMVYGLFAAPRLMLHSGSQGRAARGTA